jgi:glycosyltransferase involved in cell wall biosynthesis
VRFLFNTSCYKPACKQGGPLHSVAALAEGVAKRGHEVFVTAPNRDLNDQLDVDLSKTHLIDGVYVRFFNAEPTLLQRTGIPYFSKAGVYALGPEFAAWVGSVGSSIDAFHSHIAFTPSNRVVSRYARENGKVYFYNQRGNLDPVRLELGKWKKRVFIHLVEKGIMRRADVLLALTEYERGTFRRFAPHNRVEVIPNGIDAGFGEGDLGTPSQPVHDVLKRCGDEPVIFWMSRIHPFKGPDVFVEGSVRALKEGARFQAIVSGPDEVGLEKQLKGAVAEAGLEDRFHFTGPVGGADRMALLRRADVFVLPTPSEGFSMVILEALACGCAVITSRGAHFPEIESADAGSIIDLNADAYGKCISEYVGRGRSDLSRQGRNGTRLVQERFTWDSIVDRYLSLTAELCGAAQRK